MGLASITSEIFANSTYNWPPNVEIASIDDAIAYSIANPTTFMSSWNYANTSSGEDLRWHSEKTIYDPCPPGWRVPNGGVDGVWATAAGNTTTGVYKNAFYDDEHKGGDFSGHFGASQTIWYPAMGQRSIGDAQIRYHHSGHYWSVNPCEFDYHSYILWFDVNYVGLSYGGYGERGNANLVRCYKE